METHKTQVIMIGNGRQTHDIVACSLMQTCKQLLLSNQDTVIYIIFLDLHFTTKRVHDVDINLSTFFYKECE